MEQKAKIFIYKYMLSNTNSNNALVGIVIRLEVEIECGSGGMNLMRGVYYPSVSLIRLEEQEKPRER